MAIIRSSLVSDDTDNSPKAMDVEDPFINNPAPAAKNAAVQTKRWNHPPPKM
jgi:hypothetical protein